MPKFWKQVSSAFSLVNFSAEKVLRSIGLVLRSVKFLELLGVIINSSYGEKIALKYLMEADVSSAFSPSRRVIMSLMPHLA